MGATLYTDADYLAVLAIVSTGVPFDTACKREGMPSTSAMLLWRDANDDNAAKYARAKKAFCEAVAAEVMAIADAPLIGDEEKLQLLGVMKRPGDDGDGPAAIVLPDAQLVVTEVKRGDNVARSKLMVDTRLRILRAQDPEVWGDKVAVDNKHSGGVGFAITINSQPKPKAAP